MGQEGLTSSEDLADIHCEDALAHDPSLLWKIPSLCSPFFAFLDPIHMRERTISRHSLPSDPLRNYTDDIWAKPQLSSWLTTVSCPFLLIKGDFDSTHRLELFSVNLAEHIRQQQPVVYLSMHMIDTLTPPNMAATQAVRNIAIQTLRQVQIHPSVLFLAELVGRFRTATTYDDWFDILGLVLSKISRLHIIIYIGTSQSTWDVKNWTQRLQALLKDLRAKAPEAIIKVMIGSCRSLGQLSNSETTIMMVGRPILPPHRVRSLRKDRRVIPESLLRLPELPPLNISGDEPLDGVQGTADGSESATYAEPSSTQTSLRPTSLDGTKDVLMPKTRQDFKVAIFCALSTEADSVIAVFDHHWDRRQYGKVACDTNSYTLGAISHHNIVLVHLPGMGKEIAASAAAVCRVSFPCIELALVVGVCGGVPFGSRTTERILGDVIISNGLVQYDFGRQFPGQFKRKRTVHDSHSRPKQQIRGFLARLDGRVARKAFLDAARRHLKTLQTDKRTTDAAIYSYPGVSSDVLHEPWSIHKHLSPSQCPDWPHTCGSVDPCDLSQGTDCQELDCSSGKFVPRQRLATLPATHQQHNTQAADASAVEFEMHIGTVASGDKIMKSGQERDKVARDEGIIAFEMEGAGIWDQFHCLIIKGICDYADSHKNKQWQQYAAATAAACMKSFLDEWD